MSNSDKYQNDYHKAGLSLNIERTYTSYFRNSIILFSLGLTLIGVNKFNNKTKFNFKLILALLVILSSIILGSIGVKEYYQKLKLIKKGKYNELHKKPSDTIYIVSGLIIIFSVLFIIRLINMNEDNLLF